MIVRIMRSAILDPLLTPTKQALLAATILQPDKRWYFRELARQLHLQPSSIQRDLTALTEAGILERHYDAIVCTTRRNVNAQFFQNSNKS